MNKTVALFREAGDETADAEVEPIEDDGLAKPGKKLIERGAPLVKLGEQGESEGVVEEHTVRIEITVQDDGNDAYNGDVYAVVFEMRIFGNVAAVHQSQTSEVDHSAVIDGGVDRGGMPDREKGEGGAGVEGEDHACHNSTHGDVGVADCGKNDAVGHRKPKREDEKSAEIKGNPVVKGLTLIYSESDLEHLHDGEGDGKAGTDLFVLLILDAARQIYQEYDTAEGQADIYVVGKGEHSRYIVGAEIVVEKPQIFKLGNLVHLILLTSFFGISDKRWPDGVSDVIYIIYLF